MTLRQTPPFETLEPRRLLSASGGEWGGTTVTEYDPLTGEVRTLDAGDRIAGGDAASLDGFLADQGYEGIEQLLASLGSPDDFTARLDAILAGSLPGLNPLGGDVDVPAYEGEKLDAVLDDSGPGGRSVQPPDDRVQITDTLDFPFSAVGRLGVGCSGAMIGPFHFLTAGHCVTSGSGFRPLSQLRVTLGQDGEDRPFGVAEPTLVRTYDSWRLSGNQNDDWALITLDRSVGEYAGNYGYRFYNGTNALAGKDVTILQYPGDKPFGTQWSAEGQVGYSTSGKVYYNGTLDTAGGSSGSSVWEMTDSDDVPMVLGVHGYGGAGSGGGFNSAARITQQKFNDLNAWQAADMAARPPVDLADLTPLASAIPSSPLASGVSPNPVPVGGQFELTAAIRNVGTAPATGATVSVYASTDANINANDVLLGTLTVDVDPFENAVEQIVGRVPASLSQGTYTVGYVIDAADAIDEFNEADNVAAVGTLVVGSGDPGDGGGGNGDRLEPNDSSANATDFGSLGDVDLDDLSIHTSSDDDWFTWTAAASGTSRVDVLFSHGQGDIDVRLYDANLNQIGSGLSATDNEVVVRNVTAGQRYFLEVYGWNGATNGYDLRIDLPGTDSTAPALMSSTYAFQAAQQFTFLFDESIDPATVDAGDVTVTNLTTGQTFAGDGPFNFAAGGSSLTWAATSLLPDGNYVATLPAGSLADAAGNALAQDATLSFFVLAGDFNRDRTVNLSDFTLLANNFGRTGRLFPQGDANYDGNVNLADFTLLANRFGTSLAQPDGGLFDDDA